MRSTLTRYQQNAHLVAKEGLLKGNTIGIDATTLEANAALRSIVRRDSGEKYEEFLKQLAKEAGIETPTREQLAQMDRKRTKRMTNEEWKNPHDPLTIHLRQLLSGRRLDSRLLRQL